MLLGGAAFAANNDTQALFSEARAAFEAQDFARALLLYEQCLAHGMQGPAVHYNIGVAAYRSNNLARAESAFQEVARTPAMAAYAHYNLALVALKRDDEKTAREWLARAAGESSDEKLASLARSRLEELPKIASNTPEWSMYARSGAGFDSNVALRSASLDTIGSGQDDTFGELMLAGSYSLLPSWRLDAAAGLLRYTDLDEFDQDALSFGVVHGMTLDAWRLEPGFYATQFSLGGDVYENSVAAAIEATHTLAGYGWLRAQLRVSAVNGDGDFSGLSGSRSELGVRYEWRQQSWRFGVHARAEFNSTEDDAFASRWVEMGADARWTFSPRWTFLAGTDLRQTRHPAPSTTQDGWDDNRIAYRLEATWLFWQQAQLFMRYAHENNQSPVAENDYDRDWVAVSIEFWR